MGALDRFRAGLLERETRALQQAGFVVEEVGADSPSGWVLTVTAPDEHTGRGDVVLTIECSPAYPLTPPTVKAEQLGLVHHQNPFTGELCLLDQPTQTWRSEWTLAGYLSSQLRAALTAGAADPDQAALQAEADQGEPFSVYYKYTPSAGVLMGLGDLSLSSSSGEFEFTLSLRPSLIPSDDAAIPGRLLGSVDRIRDGKDSYERPPHLSRVILPPPQRSGTGLWIAVDQPPRENDPANVWRKYVNPANKSLRPAQLGDRNCQLLAITFPEERAKDSTVQGWLFVLRLTPQAISRHTGRARKTAVAPETFHFVRGYPAGRDDLAFRAPQTRALESSEVAVVGCGAVGSVIIDHLARAGVGTFTLIDFDQLEPGNITRHAANFDTVSMPKTEAMANLILQINPYAHVRTLPGALGMGHSDGERDEVTVMNDVLRSSDVIVDATADVSLQQYTSAVALDQGTPWVGAEGTVGLAGGAVVQSPSRGGGCFWCFLWHQLDGTMPTPNAIDTADVQPVGCGQRTFTGSGFDLAVISAQAARVVTGLLLSGEADGYPQDGCDAHILTLRAESGSPVPPTWTGHTYEVHPRCALH